MKFKRVSSMILAVLLFALSLASCEDTTVDPGEPDTSIDPPVSDNDVTDTDPVQEGLVLEMTDFDGAVLRVHGISKKRNFGYYSNDDIWVESDSPDPFYSSVYARMQDCLDEYNFSIAIPIPCVLGMIWPPMCPAAWTQSMLYVKNGN